MLRKIRSRKEIKIRRLKKRIKSIRIKIKDIVKINNETNDFTLFNILSNV